METYSKYTQLIPTRQEAIEYFNSNGVSGDTIPTNWHLEMIRKQWKDSIGKKIMQWKKYADLRIGDIKVGKIQPKANQAQQVVNSKKKEGLELFAEQVANLQQQNAGLKELPFEKLLFKRLMELKQERQSTDQDVIQLFYDKCNDITGNDFRIYNFLQAIK